MTIKETTLYQGVPERTDKGGFLVLKNGQPLSPVPSQNLHNHSPYGFNWGYGGSGPAQLALALLLDVSANPTIALAHYQQFKWEKIAKLELDQPWDMTGMEIEGWLQAAIGVAGHS